MALPAQNNKQANISAVPLVRDTQAGARLFGAEAAFLIIISWNQTDS